MRNQPAPAAPADMLEDVVAEAYIVDAVRTPVGKRNGGLSAVHPADLAAHVLRGQVSRVHCGQAAVALAYRGTYRVNDVCLSHDVLHHVRGAARALIPRAGLLTSLLTSRLPGPPGGIRCRMLATESPCSGRRSHYYP